MLLILAWVPVATTVVLGLVWLSLGESSPGRKVLGVAVFLIAVYLQFFSRFSLIGMLLQIVLAVALAGWRRMDRATGGL